MKLYNGGPIEECAYFYPSTQAYALFCEEKECKSCNLHPFLAIETPSSKPIEIKNGIFLYLGYEYDE